VVMTLPTWITVASLGDHLRLLDLLRRIDLCGEAIMAVLQAIDGLVGLSTLLLRIVQSKIGHSLVAACGDARRQDGEGHCSSQRQGQFASKRNHGGSPFKSPMLKTILELDMEILHRPLDLRCAIWHNLKDFLDQGHTRMSNRRRKHVNVDLRGTIRSEDHDERAGVMDFME
jgi:hypothetical protein